MIHEKVMTYFRQILSKSEGELPADEVVERGMCKGREKRGLDGSKNSVDVLADLLFSDSSSDADLSSSSAASSSCSSGSSSESDSDMNNNIDTKEEKEAEEDSPPRVLRDEEVLVAGEVEISRGEPVAAGEGSVACVQGDGTDAGPASPAAADDDVQEAVNGEDVKVS